MMMLGIMKEVCVTAVTDSITSLTQKLDFEPFLYFYSDLVSNKKWGFFRLFFNCTSKALRHQGQQATLGELVERKLGK